MKTVFVDSSLCLSTLRDDASAEDISEYIKYLAKAGVKYIELDFRALMKLKKLPRGIGYIFRAVDPMFMRITHAFDFNYVTLTLSDLKRNIKSDVPIMLEVPYVENNYRGVVRYAQSRTDGMITAVRFCSDFGYKSVEETRRFVSKIRNDIPLPVDFCPRNTRKTALDSALKLTLANADSVSFVMPGSNLRASLEEYVVALLAFYDFVPSGFDLYGFLGAAYYCKNIFRDPENTDIMKLFEMLDRDLRTLKNADTGEDVKLNFSLKTSATLADKYFSALELMMRRANIDKGTSDMLVDAVKYFDADVCSSGMLHEPRKGLLN